MNGAVVTSSISVLVFKGLAVVVLLGVALQFFLAGMTVFGGGTGWELHSATGGALGVPVISLFLMSMARGLQHYRRMTGLLLAIYLLQVTLGALGETLPLLGALHPVNGLVMGLVSVTIMKRLRQPE